MAQGIYASFGVSGGHLNPAVTIAFASIGTIAWRDVAPYFAGQFAGSFLASVLVYVIYINGAVAWRGAARLSGGADSSSVVWQL